MQHSLCTISIIIPAYNEERTIHLIFDKVRAVELINVIAKEVVIVNDGSMDHLVDIVKRSMEGNPS